MGFGDFAGFDAGVGGDVGGIFGGGADAGGGGIGGLLSALMSLIGGAGTSAASGISDLASTAGRTAADNPLASLQALTGMGGMFANFMTPQAAQAPSQFPQGPNTAGPYPRRGIPRADFQAQGLSGASPDFYDQMTNPNYQNPFAYSFQPKAEDPRQVYA